MRLRAELYRAFARVGFTPSEVDGMEVWQAAVLLGSDVDSKDGSIADRMAAERHTLVERAARIREMRGSPEPSESVDITQDIMRQMGIKVI